MTATAVAAAAGHPTRAFAFRTGSFLSGTTCHFFSSREQFATNFGPFRGEPNPPLRVHKHWRSDAEGTCARDVLWDMLFSETA